MIAFLSTQSHAYAVQSMMAGRFGPDLPRIGQLPYETALTAERLPAATYIFTDLERLTPWERRLAADLHRALTEAGCRCLNDPARVLTRLPLLVALQAAGINPFRAWRLDEQPRPQRFPVFLRQEADHGRPLTGLLADQRMLEAATRELLRRGIPLGGLLAVEFCAAPIAPGTWRKWGTFRIGEVFSTDHAVIEDNWLVKEGTKGLATEAMFAEEHAAVRDNRYAPVLAPAFALAGIDYGRADHALAEGREVVFEINTNPNLAPLEKQRLEIRDRTLLLARERFAAALRAIDSGDGAPLAVPLSDRRRQQAMTSAQLGVPYRP